MIRFASFSTCVLLTLASLCAHSYELGTHAFITKLMFAKTQFGHATHGPMLIANLGFRVKNPDDASRDTPQGTKAFSVLLIRGEDGIWRIDGM